MRIWTQVGSVFGNKTSCQHTLSSLLRGYDKTILEPFQFHAKALNGSKGHKETFGSVLQVAVNASGSRLGAALCADGCPDLEHSP